MPSKWFKEFVTLNQSIRSIQEHIDFLYSYHLESCTKQPINLCIFDFDHVYNTSAEIAKELIEFFLGLELLMIGQLRSVISNRSENVSVELVSESVTDKSKSSGT